MGDSARLRVAVFIDWQNAYKTAREAFGLTDLPNEYGNFSPFLLSKVLAAGNSRSAEGQPTDVKVFRGLPSQKRDPRSYAANRRQAAAWEREMPGIVKAIMRPLRYPFDYPNSPPVEKGVDVELAVAAIEATLQKTCDVAIIFSHDTDLVPVVESIARLAGTEHVETAAWESPAFKSRLRPKVANGSIHHHRISRRVFKIVETPTNFAHNE